MFNNNRTKRRCQLVELVDPENTAHQAHNMVGHAEVPILRDVAASVEAEAIIEVGTREAGISVSAPCPLNVMREALKCHKIDHITVKEVARLGDKVHSQV
jgi:hypothetical protein